MLATVGAITTVEGVCSVNVLRRLSRCLTTGELVEHRWVGEESWVGEVGGEIISSSQRIELVGRGCTHCIEVPCQLHFECRAETIAFICMRSMLSTERTVNVCGIS